MVTATVQPIPAFVQSVSAGLVYWQSRTRKLDDAQIGRLEGERQNLYRAVQFGLALPETWQETAEVALQKAEEAERVKTLLEDLPEKQRQAVTLRIFEGMSFKEVGALIGSSEGAARVNYHHGIRRLREMLG